MEAMAHGLPSIATDVGGNPENIENEKSGIIVPAGNYEILADNIIKLIEDEVKRNKLGIEARKRMKDYFCMKNVADKNQLIYRQMVIK